MGSKLGLICLLAAVPFSSFGDGKLLDHRGYSFSIDELQGKIVLLIIGFTNCEDICPTEMARATIALNEMKENISLVQPIFLTVDPDRDKPKVIANYLKNFHPSFIGISGNSETLEKLVQQYGIMPKKKKHYGEHEKIDHGFSTFILNSHGEIEVAVLPGLPPSHLTSLLSKFTEKGHQG